LSRARIWPLAILLVLINGCVTMRPPGEVTTDTRQKGLASWYGEEFAGRATANGEIFDPMQLTAAHRTLPFGTVVEVKNPKNGQVIMVRINDRGPYVGNRIIDLSYAAAQKLGMVNDGVGEVELRVLKVGAGEREAPVPLVVSAGDPARAVKRNSAQEAPDVVFPLPPDVVAPAPAPASTTTSEPVVDRVEVIEEHGGVETRKQVSADGRTVENAPVASGDQRELGASSAAALDSRSAHRNEVPATPPTRHILLQLGAFQSLDNANELARKVREIAPKVYVEKFNDLNRVRIGPFATREAAVEMKEKLDSAAINAIIVTE
jgi:rare lipoprotein A